MRHIDSLKKGHEFWEKAFEHSESEEISKKRGLLEICALVLLESSLQ
jgi:hypothetical protein